MRKYLLSNTHRFLLFVIVSYFIAYSIFSRENYSFTIDNFFNFYSNLIFIIGVFIILVFMKYENWKNKLKLLILGISLISIFYITKTQLNNLYESGILILNPDKFKNSEGEILFENIEKVSAYMSVQTNFQVFYRLGKILLFDLFIIFSYLAINKTINEFDERKNNISEVQ